MLRVVPLVVIPAAATTATAVGAESRDLAAGHRTLLRHRIPGSPDATLRATSAIWDDKIDMCEAAP